MPEDTKNPDATTKADKSLPDIVSDLWEMTVTYARQETVDPLKGLGRYLAWGSAGAICIGLGTLLLALSALRALQSETGSWFTGSLNFIPYVVVLVGLAIVMGVLALRITKGDRS